MIEFNIDRVIRDGLEIERNFLEHVEPRCTQRLSKFTSDGVRTLLERFYKGEGSLPYLGCLLNAVIFEEKASFFLNYQVMERLVKTDTQVPQKELTPFLFKTFMEKVIRGGFFKEIGVEEGICRNVYTLIHPDLLKYFYRAMGREAMAEQRSYVLQYVKGVKEFQHEFKEKVEDKEEESHDFSQVTPPPIPPSVLEEGVESDTDKNKEKERIREGYLQEKAKLKMLQDKARMAESFRLNQDLQPEEEKNATLQAVEFATEAKVQEKRVFDLEWQLLKLEEVEMTRKGKEN